MSPRRLTTAERIRAFRQQCVDAEYTDTETAWELLNAAERDLRQLAHARKYLRDALNTIDATGSIDMVTARKLVERRTP